MRHGAGVFALVLLPALAAAQDPAQGPPAGAPYTPPTGRDRVNWVVEGTASLPVLVFNLGDSAVSTYANWPKEWGRGLAGFSKRVADEEAYSAVSGTLEAGIGSLWGEDPRYRRSDQHGVWRRTRHTLVAVVAAPRSDGHLAPAWARFAAEPGAIEIENTWLPLSARTSSATAWRVGEDFMFRAVSNVWDEFWPDLRKRLPAPLKRIAPQ
jgi:hypothetical protein